MAKKGKKKNTSRVVATKAPPVVVSNGKGLTLGRVAKAFNSLSGNPRMLPYVGFPGPKELVTYETSLSENLTGGGFLACFIFENSPYIWQFTIGADTTVAPAFQGISNIPTALADTEAGIEQFCPHNRVVYIHNTSNEQKIGGGVEAGRVVSLPDIEDWSYASLKSRIMGGPVRPQFTEKIVHHQALFSEDNFLDRSTRQAMAGGPKVWKHRFTVDVTGLTSARQLLDYTTTKAISNAARVWQSWIGTAALPNSVAARDFPRLMGSDLMVNVDLDLGFAGIEPTGDTYAASLALVAVVYVGSTAYAVDLVVAGLTSIAGSMGGGGATAHCYMHDRVNASEKIELYKDELVRDGTLAQADADSLQPVIDAVFLEFRSNSDDTITINKTMSYYNDAGILKISVESGSMAHWRRNATVVLIESDADQTQKVGVTVNGTVIGIPTAVRTQSTRLQYANNDGLNPQGTEMYNNLLERAIANPMLNGKLVSGALRMDPNATAHAFSFGSVFDAFKDVGKKLLHDGVGMLANRALQSLAAGDDSKFPYPWEIYDEDRAQKGLDPWTVDIGAVLAGKQASLSRPTVPLRTPYVSKHVVYEQAHIVESKRGSHYALSLDDEKAAAAPVHSGVAFTEAGNAASVEVYWASEDKVPPAAHLVRAFSAEFHVVHRRYTGSEYRYETPSQGTLKAIRFLDSLSGSVRPGSDVGNLDKFSNVTPGGLLVLESYYVVEGDSVTGVLFNFFTNGDPNVLTSATTTIFDPDPDVKVVDVMGFPMPLLSATGGVRQKKLLMESGRFSRMLVITDQTVPGVEDARTWAEFYVKTRRSWRS